MCVLFLCAASAAGFGCTARFATGFTTGLLALLADGNAAVNVERVSSDVVAGGVERQECTHARNLPATSLARQH